MKQKKKYSVLKHVDFLLLDIVCIQLCFFGACMVRRDTFIDFFNRYIYISGILLGTTLLVAAFWNVYSGILRRNILDEFKNVFALTAGLFVSLTGYCFATKTSASYSRAILFTYIIIVIPVLFVVRVGRKEIVRKRVRNSLGEILLFIREEDIEKKIEQFTDRAYSGVVVTGIITYDKADRKQVQGIPIVGSREDLYNYVENHNVECVYIYLKGVQNLHKYIDYLVRKDILVYRALRNLEKSSFRYSVVEMNGYKTLCVREREQSLGFAFTKRVADIVIALGALIVSLPIMAVTAIAIKMEDGGTVFYKSERIGQYGKKFYIYKFRSMKLNADRLEDMLTPEELARYYKEFKLDNDPRITRVGNFIRRHSIDELPQFFNILKGDMAMIGPRPLIEREVEVNYPNNKDLLLSLKPGLTGYWQAYARNNVGYENGERQKMELYYIEHSCWNLDIHIIFKTVKVVLTGDGAQ